MKLNANRKVTGVLRGFDQFMNLVLEDSFEIISETEKNSIGMTVRLKKIVFVCLNALNCFLYCAHPARLIIFFFQVIRGNSVVLIEPLEKV